MAQLERLSSSVGHLTAFIRWSRQDYITSYFMQDSKHDEGEYWCGFDSKGVGRRSGSRLRGFPRRLSAPLIPHQDRELRWHSPRLFTRWCARSSISRSAGTHHLWHRMMGNQQILAALLRHSSATVSHLWYWCGKAVRGHAREREQAVALCGAFEISHQRKKMSIPNWSIIREDFLESANCYNLHRYFSKFMIIIIILYS